MKTHNCEPTLTDSQVLEFCKAGILRLERVVPDEINRRVYEYLDEHPIREPSELLTDEPWFVENVILNPEAAGAIRSLLGKDFGLPILMSNHRHTEPSPSMKWHTDGYHERSPLLNYLQVFYYPQDVTRAMGPTELLPSSHFLYSISAFMGHYENLRNVYSTAAPAGSIFITNYSVWHRKSASTIGGKARNLMKYNYYRTVPPKRDWIVEPEFDFATAKYGNGPSHPLRRQTRDTVFGSEMMFWLSGLSDSYYAMGGQNWPHTNKDAKFVDTPYGYPLTPERERFPRPDWAEDGAGIPDGSRSR